VGKRGPGQGMSPATINYDYGGDDAKFDDDYDNNNNNFMMMLERWKSCVVGEAYNGYDAYADDNNYKRIGKMMMMMIM
jgi:hypothetical protein